MKTVFIFGAGASIGNSNDKQAGFPHYGLPIVADIPYYSYQFIREFNGYDNTLTEPESSILQIFKHIPDEIAKYKSFDTYGKMLSATGQKDKLNNLKLFLISFFKYLQDLRNSDLRYDLLVASIIQNNHEKHYIPTDYSFISWNYDTLFEKSVLKFFPNKSLDEIFSYNSHHSLTKVNYVKLNGSIAGPTNKEYPLCLEKDDCSRKFYFVELLGENFSVNKNVRNISKHYLDFSWEVGLAEPRTECASKLLELADTINIIGYSLPNINRTIDENIFYNVGREKKVKINIQCGNASESIKEKLISSYLIFPDKIKFNIVSGLDEFPIY